jgi:hypothetical protein
MSKLIFPCFFGHLLYTIYTLCVYPKEQGKIRYGRVYTNATIEGLLVEEAFFGVIQRG